MKPHLMSHIHLGREEAIHHHDDRDGHGVTRDLYLVTGGTGFLGVAIVRLLLDRGNKVRIMVRSNDPIMSAEARVEMFLGSVEDAESVKKACVGVKGIFHLVGIVEHSRSAAAHIQSVNVKGTTNVIEAAAFSAVSSGGRCPKVVFASTSGTVAVSRDSHAVRGDADEFAESLVAGWPYYASKIAAERQATHAAKRLGVPLVILRPSSILGPGELGLHCEKSKEYYRHKSVYKHVSRSVPFMPQGGINFVDVRDVAPAFVTAMDNSDAEGGAFCLGGDSNMTLDQFFTALERLSGVPKTRVLIPYALAWTGISALYTVTTAMGRPYHVDPVVVEMANHFWYCDSSAARKVLGFQPRPWVDTLKDSLGYIAEWGHTLGLPKGVPHMPRLCKMSRL